MVIPASSARAWDADGSVFRHEALLYAGQDEFATLACAFIRDAVSAREPILVMVNAARIELLQSALDGEREFVEFADMGDVGRNPARIIPAWSAFVAAKASQRQRLRGIGEPIWAGRGPAEMVECQRHEMLLNLAFADAGPFWLLCPYDRAALDGAVIEEAQRSHPFVGAADRVWRSAGYLGSEAASATLDGPLPEPPGRRRRLDFGIGQLRAVRKLVLEQAAAAGFDAARAADFVLAVNEAATNSLLHGGGAGTIQVWDEEDALVCEIRDQGHISRPLAGRERPAAHTDGGRGLWMVNELCDLAQLRSSPGGTVFRLQMRRS